MYTRRPNGALSIMSTYLSFPFTGYRRRCMQHRTNVSPPVILSTMLQCPNNESIRNLLQTNFNVIPMPPATRSYHLTLTVQATEKHMTQCTALPLPKPSGDDR